MTTPKKLHWQCRRGMLELDLLLIPFLEKTYPHLNETQQEIFVRLLACHDQDLYAWLVKHETPEDPSFLPLIELIHHARSSAI
jgi:antitoxin CptB